MFGLRNQSGSCWVNATLQAVFRIPEVQVRYTESELAPINPIDASLHEIWSTQGDEGLKDFYACVKTAVMPAGEGIGDSHELLAFLCDKLPYLDSLLRFKVGNKVTCNACKHSSTVVDSLVEFSISPSGRGQTLVENVGHAVTPTVVPDWTCDTCKGKGCTKQLLMSTFPDIFAFHITSLKSSVSYSPVLILNGFKYGLLSIVCWNGGHWWTYGRTMGGEWAEYDDSNVRTHGKTKFPLSDNVRLLFYYRIKE